jgi:hypothetical protein
MISNFNDVFSNYKVQTKEMATNDIEILLKFQRNHQIQDSYNSK